MAKQPRINRKAALELIKSGKFCTITFATRGEDKIRVMNGRTGVKKGLKGKPAPYRAADHGLITFHESNGGGYKSVPKERILSVNGKQVI